MPADYECAFFVNNAVGHTRVHNTWDENDPARQVCVCSIEYVCVYMYVCMYMYMYICMCVYICIYVYVCMYIWLFFVFFYNM